MEETEWKKEIKDMRNDFNSLETNKERGKRNLKEKLIEAVKKRAADRFGILFSGGIDSSTMALIAKNLNCNFKCYSIGLENAQDLEYAEKVANKLNLELKKKVLSLEELENVLKIVVKLLGTNVVNLEVGCVNYIALKLAKEDNMNILFSGLGSEEIFAGYQRHLEAFENNNFENVHKECWNGLENIWQRDLKRDYLLSKELNVEIRMPFLDKEVIKAAMNIHPMFKISKDFKKIILREIAEDLGLKKEFAWRRKKASQYGSSISKGIEKLARNNGFKYKKDYLESIK